MSSLQWCPLCGVDIVEYGVVYCKACEETFRELDRYSEAEAKALEEAHETSPPDAQQNPRYQR